MPVLLQVVIFFRDVTVSSRILFQIFLVIRFGRKEIPQRFELDSQRSAGFSLLPVIQTPERRVLSTSAILFQYPSSSRKAAFLYVPQCPSTTVFTSSLRIRSARAASFL